MATLAIKTLKRTKKKKVRTLRKHYAKVFSEERAKRFPPKREDDHEIKFVENAPKFFDAKVYQMSTQNRSPSYGRG